MPTKRAKPLDPDTLQRRQEYRRKHIQFHQAVAVKVSWISDRLATAPCPLSSLPAQLLIACRQHLSPSRVAILASGFGFGMEIPQPDRSREDKACSDRRGSRVLLARYKKFLFVPVCRRREARRGWAGRPSPRTRCGPVT